MAHVRVVGTIESVCLSLSYQPQLLMHVHLEEEMYSHSDQDECGFPNQFANGVGSETSVPIDPQVSVVSDGNRRKEASQFQ